MLDGVGQQVGHDLQQAVRIGIDAGLFGAAFKDQPDISPLRVPAVGLQCLLQQLIQRQGAQLQRHAAAFELGQVQNVVDQPTQTLAVAPRDAGQFGGRSGQHAARACGQQAQGAQHRGQGRAQLVAHRGQEFVLHALDAPVFAQIVQRHGVEVLAVNAPAADRHRQDTSVLARHRVLKLRRLQK